MADCIFTATDYVIGMPHARFSLTQKSLFYTTKTFLGGAFCWWVLTALHVPNPIWAVITVILVSDPDLSTAKSLVTARVVNTLVGCCIGLVALLLFGYSPLVAMLTASLTILLIMSIEHYPANWRLAPATVIILMDAGRLAHSHAEEIHYALLRASEIGLGCAVALVLALAYTRLFTTAKAPPQQDGA